MSQRLDVPKADVWMDQIGPERVAVLYFSTGAFYGFYRPFLQLSQHNLYDLNLVLELRPYRMEVNVSRGSGEGALVASTALSPRIFTYAFIYSLRFQVRERICRWPRQVRSSCPHGYRNHGRRFKAKQTIKKTEH